MIRVLSAARADFRVHQVPESGYWLADMLADMLFGAPLVALMFWAVIS